MWRITSNSDVVATGLLKFGDYLHILGPKSLKTHRKNNRFLSHLETKLCCMTIPVVRRSLVNTSHPSIKSRSTPCSPKRR
ncbi:hypothetical protein BS47DRAFT_738790 [Hydnum rufescens UP504]|uniref:Uncharacterized protein n=1 Tax=Hydnum rufescens UP504 TaxID=1448309 RepID=A0A9P6B108_9AGAM|nr:hypothetical protein BS47DRAFT_738790 [Hydnum rufescens UP504]